MNEKEVYAHSSKGGGGTYRKGLTKSHYKVKEYKDGYQVAGMGRVTSVKDNFNAFKSGLSNTRKSTKRGLDIGTWKDPNTNKWEIEPSKRIKSEQKAVALGKKYKQEGILRWKDFGFISTK